MNPLLASMMLGLFAVAPPAGKVEVRLGQETRDIKDGVGLFSSEAIANAQKRIDEIRTDFKISLTVETIDSISGVKPAALRKMSNRQRMSLLRETAIKHADEANSSGIFILIIKDPPHVTVVGWPATRELEISSVKREILQKYLSKQLSADSDRALIGTCDTFRDMMLSLQSRPAAPLSLPTALVLIGSILGVWILLRLIRSRVVSPALPIYQPAMFGSLFGVPAGYWINDRLFQAEHPIAPPAVATIEPPSEEPVHSDPLIEPDPINVGEGP